MNLDNLAPWLPLRNVAAQQLRTATMLEYGEPYPGTTAMAKTVGVPCGIAVQLILDGTQ